MFSEDKQKIKKLAYRMYLYCAIAFAAGAIILASVWNTKTKWINFLGIAGVILMALSLLAFSVFFDIFYKMQRKIEAEENNEPYRETYINWPPWFLKWGRNVLFVFIFISFGVFAPMHENDFGGNRFLWESLFAGAIFGLLIYNFFKFQKPTWSENRNMSIEIGFYIVIGAIFLAVVFGPLINNSFSKTAPVCKEYPIVSKSNKYLSINDNGREERFKPKRRILDKLPDSGMVILCIKKGFLGYDFVNEFKMK